MRLRTIRKDSEHLQQCALIEWANHPITLAKYPPLRLLFAVPNGGLRNPITAARLKREGVRPGVPDLCLPWPAKGFSGLWIEMKYGKNKPSQAQAEFIALLRLAGHFVEVCYSWDEARTQLERYLTV